MKKSVMLLSLLLIGTRVFAEADLNPAIFNQNTAKTVDERTGKPKTVSINPSAKQAQKSQSNAAATNAAIGQALMATGAAMMSHPPTRAPGAALMAMGILAMMQSAHDKGAAAASYDTGLSSQTNDDKTGTNALKDGDGGFTESKIKEGKAKLAEAGYAISEKGLTNPDGSITPASAFGSAASMSAAGIDSAAIAEAQKILGNPDSGARVSSVGVNTGGGGGSSEGDGGNQVANDAAMVNPFAMNAQAKAALVAGKTVMFDGEPIGVRGQNIFDMVHTCYQKKRAGQQFIESEAGVATRMPASVKAK